MHVIIFLWPITSDLYDRIVNQSYETLRNIAYIIKTNKNNNISVSLVPLLGAGPSCSTKACGLGAGRNYSTLVGNEIALLLV